MDGELEVRLGALQAQGIELAEHQHLPLPDIQELSTVPLRSQLFASLLVFQNYVIGDAAMRWSDDVAVADFVAPIRTNYPLTLVVRPGADSLSLDLVYQGGFFDAASAQRMLDEFCALLGRVAVTPSMSLQACGEAVALPLITRAAHTQPTRGAGYHPPVTMLQKRIAQVWERAFGVTDVGIDENFFDLGGHSLLLIRVHGLLCRELGRDLSVLDVFSNPTVRKLATALEPGERTATSNRIQRTARPRTSTTPRWRAR